MSAHKSTMTTEINPWLLWVIFFSTILIFTSLWIVPQTEWHIIVSACTFIIVLFGSSTRFKTMGFVLGLVLFLASMQILFSPYVRGMFLKSLDEGFQWTDWQYLLYAVERFAWPLLIISLFQNHLNNPSIAGHLTRLLSPLAWLGLKIDRLQSLILLALRFLPSLRREWDRLAHFQTYFSGRHVRKSLIQRLRYWQGILRALIAHTINRSVTTGNMLALRGLPGGHKFSLKQPVLLSFAIWLPLGILVFFIDHNLSILWLIMTVWIGLTAIASSRGSSV